MNEHSLIYMTNLYEEAMDLNTKLQEEIERLKEELEFEKATNKELISTGADLENKLYEEQDENKRLNNIIKKAHNFIMLHYHDDLYDDSLTWFEDKLMSILKGSDKE